MRKGYEGLSRLARKEMGQDVMTGMVFLFTNRRLQVTTHFDLQLCPQAATKPKRSAFIQGFSLHANVGIHKNDREGIERLCRYGLRPAIALERLSWTDDGQIRYQYKRPAPNGDSGITCEPTEFLAKLAALIPPPRKHLTRYHGVFAPNHAWRSQIVLPAPKDSSSTSRSSESDSESTIQPEPGDEKLPATVLARRLDWAALMLRVFAIDVLECPCCSGRMRVLAFIIEPCVVQRILDHLNLSADAPTAARSPPSAWRAVG